MNYSTALDVAREAERLFDVLDHRRIQRSGDDEEISSLMHFAEDRYFPPWHTCDLPLRNHTVYQCGVFGQPGLTAFGQETVVMLRSHLNPYLHDGTNSRKHRKMSSGNLTTESASAASSGCSAGRCEEVKP